MDADETVPKMLTDDLPETFVIFITENDVLGGGLALYHVERKITELDNKNFNDGTHIIYVNGKYRGTDPIGDLMHDFSCKKADDMKSNVLADKARSLKENSKGVNHMCRIMKDLIAEERVETNIETASKLLEQGDMTEDRIKEFFNFSDEQMKRVKEHSQSI